MDGFDAPVTSGLEFAIFTDGAIGSCFWWKKVIDVLLLGFGGLAGYVCMGEQTRLFVTN